MMVKTKQITVTTMQDILTSHHGNQSATARDLSIERNTLRAMIDDNRPNVVLIGEDGSYTLLK